MQWSGAGIPFLLHPGGTLGVPTHMGRTNLNTSGTSGCQGRKEREEHIAVIAFLL